MMRVLYVYCHPLPESFHAAVREAALASLKAAGHEVDLLDLYAENVRPGSDREGGAITTTWPQNRIGLEPMIARLGAAEAIVMQFPTWCFGMPAMLKGFCDRRADAGRRLRPLGPGECEAHADEPSTDRRESSPTVARGIWRNGWAIRRKKW